MALESDSAGGGKTPGLTAMRKLVQAYDTREGHRLKELYHGICPASYIRFLLLLKFILLLQ